MLEEAVTRGLWDSEDLILDAVMDHLMFSKLRDAISGRVPSSGLTDAFDGIITSLLHHAFFGPGASKTVSSLAKRADEDTVLDAPGPKKTWCSRDVIIPSKASKPR